MYQPVVEQILAYQSFVVYLFRRMKNQEGKTWIE